MARLKTALVSAATIFLALGSLAAGVVAPTKSELEAMYNAAAQEVSAGQYREALQKIDAIDARQPDFPAALNLRGVAWMRLEEFGKAETALRKARDLDPTFWEARYNLAEVPFLQENWTEARRRFSALYNSPEDKLPSLTSDLIEFKILLTYILEKKEKLGSKLLEKFQTTTTSPAATLAKAAFAFREQKPGEGKALVATAEKQFPSATTKLFLESFYEVGWLKKESGSGPVALEVESPEERLTRAQGDLGKAERAYRRGDLEAALQLLDEIDAATPNQAVAANLRGQILLEQGQFDGAESAFRHALTAEPGSETARYGLARILFAKKDDDAARKAFEELLGATAGGRKKEQREQLIRYQIYLTLLRQGRDGAAQKAMDEFKMMGSTPALYYAQAAWAFQHGNPKQGENWIANAHNVYPEEQNRAFAAPLVSLGWGDKVGVPTPAAVSNVTGPAANPSPTPAPSAAPAETPTPVVAEAKETPEPAAETEKSTPQPSLSPSQVARTEEKEPEASATPARKRSIASKTSRDDDEKKSARSRRTAARDRDGSPTPSPAPSPQPSETPRQNLGDKVVRFLTYPFRHRNDATPTPSPAASPSGTRPTASPSPGRGSRN